MRFEAFPLEGLPCRHAFAHNDLNCEDWRSRDRMWDQTRHALAFFQRHLPFAKMKPSDELVENGAYCLAKPGEVYAVYLPPGVRSRINIETGKYELRWYNPREGGELVRGEVVVVQGSGPRALGVPPADPGRDWVALLRRH